MKITKQPKKLAPATPEVARLLETVASTPDDMLPEVLDSISEWCWPRGDLHYWTKTLNRFDVILAETCRDYDLHNMQINEFTPKRKRLIVAVLRFSRLLIENCTNRKLYNSFEHLNELLFTRDLDVLEATLRLILRPAQQLGTQSSSRHDVPISQERLSVLAVTWVPREHGLSLIDAAHDDLVVPKELLSVRFQFYQRASASTALTSDGVADGAGEVSRQHTVEPVSTPARYRGSIGRPLLGANASAGGAVEASGPSAAHAQPSSSSASASAPQEGLITIDLGQVNLSGRSAVDIFADATERHSIPADNHFELYHKIRLAIAMEKTETRRQMLLCRLLAVACYAHLVPESTAMTRLFLYEPDIVQRTAALVDPKHQIGAELVAAALYALEGLGRYRHKLTEVLNSVNASVNHGVLLYLLKIVIEDLATDAPQTSDHLVDSLFGFIAFITSSATGSTMVVNAGLIPVLVQMMEIKEPNTYMVQRTISRAIGMLDAAMYAIPTAFNIFVGATGLDVLVARIEAETVRDVHEGAKDSPMKDSGWPSASPDNPYGRIAFGRSSLLRNMLKLISHMMQQTGTADGLRNVVNSTLLKSIKRIMENRDIFGPQILALAINITATFVHNEPASLSIIQENELPKVFLDLVEDDTSANFDVIVAIPNALGALCLNQAGLDLVMERSVIKHLLKLFTSDRHVKTLQDRSNASTIGTAVDELVRHHPSMKKDVFEGITNVLDTIAQAGREFVPSPEEESNYRLAKVPAAKTADLPADDEPMTETANDMGDSNAGAASSSAIPGRPVPERSSSNIPSIAEFFTQENDTRRSQQLVADNNVTAFIDVIARFLEAFFQTTSHCKDFLKAGGLDKILQLYALPCLPYNFPSTIAAESTVSLLRCMLEISPQHVINSVLRDVGKSMLETRNAWSMDKKDEPSSAIGDLAPSASLLLAYLTPRPAFDLDRCNLELSKLITLRARVQLLSDLSQTLSFVSGKLPTTFLQSLAVESTDPTSFSIHSFAQLHRSAAREKMVLKKAGQTDEEQANNTETVDNTSSPKGPAASAFNSSGDNITIPSELVDGDLSQEEGDKPPTASADPVARNLAMLRSLISSILVSANTTFTETSRLLYSSRRLTDTTHRRSAAAVADKVGFELAENLGNLSNLDKSEPTLSVTYSAVMIGLTMRLCYDERAHGGLHFSILAAFEKHGGVYGLRTAYKFVVDIISGFVSIGERPSQSGWVQTEAAKELLGPAFGMLKVIFDFSLHLVTSRPIFETWPLSHYVDKPEAAGQDHYLDPYQFIVSLRSTLFTVVREAWDLPWLSALPLLINKAIVQTMLQIVSAESEVRPPPKKEGLPAPATAALGRLSATQLGVEILRTRTNVVNQAPPQPADADIAQLADMGFPRRAAHTALLRCRNNVNAATEFLLMHPELVERALQEQTEEDNAPAPPNQEAENEPSGASVPGERSESAADGDGVMDADQAAADGADVAAANPELQDEVMAEGEGQGEGEADNESHSTPAEGVQPSNLSDQIRQIQSLAERDIVQQREKLDALRAEVMPTLTKRSLELADRHQDLVFDAKSAYSIAFTKLGEVDKPVLSLLEDICSQTPEVSDSPTAGERIITVRLRLLALIANDAKMVKYLNTELLRRSMTTLSFLDQQASAFDDAGKVPDWFASFMLLSASLLGLDEEIIDVPLVDKNAVQVSTETPKPQSRSSPLFSRESVQMLFKRVLATIERFPKPRLSRQELLAVLRVLVVLTRDYTRAVEFARLKGVEQLLKLFATDNATDVSGCQALVMLVLRHVAESPAMLRQSFEQDLKAIFWHDRQKATDVNNLFRGSLQHTILRDPDCFLEVAGETVEMYEVNPSRGIAQGHIRLRAGKDDALKQPVNAVPVPPQLAIASTVDEDEAPASPTKATPVRAGQDMDASMATFRTSDDQANQPSDALDSVIQHLLSELLTVMKEQKDKKSGDAIPKPIGASAIAQLTNTGDEMANHASISDTLASEKADDPDPGYYYSCFIMTCLAELLSSYPACKTSFVSFSRKRLYGHQPMEAGATPLKPKGNAVLHFFLNDLVPLGFLRSYDAPELRKRMVQSNLAMSVVVALTSDVNPPTGARTLGTDLVAIRRFALDGVAKAIKDGSSSTEPIEARYGRLYALTDLCYRLLTARPNVTAHSRQTEDLTLHMAKTMLEKNFVTVLTSALADVDLNLPSVKTLLDAVLRPLEHLTKVAIKMGKADRTGSSSNNGAKAGDETDATSTDWDSIDEDEDLEEDEAEDGREETPDFYRNSSLGMHTGEMESGTGFDDDMSDDEDDEEMDEEDIEMEEYESGSDISDSSTVPMGEIVVEEDDSDDDMDDDDDDEDDNDLDDDDLDNEDIDEDDVVEVLDEEDWEDEDDEQLAAQGAETGIESLDFVVRNGEPVGDAQALAADFFADERDAEIHMQEMQDMQDMLQGGIGSDGEQDEQDEEDESILEMEYDGGLRALEVAHDHGAGGSRNVDDRFGANWEWSRDGLSGRRESGRGGSSAGVFPPTFFLRGAQDTSQAVHSSGLRVGRRDMTSNNADVASHPLLIDDTAEPSNPNAGTGGRRPRRIGTSGGYQDWVQSMEDLVGGGALEFLGSLINHPRSQGDVRIEMSSNGAVRIGGIGGMSVMPGGFETSLRRHHAHHHGTSSNTANDRTSDPVSAVQDFSAQLTSTRRTEEARLVFGPTLPERVSRIRNHFTNLLVPRFLQIDADKRQKAEEAEKHRAKLAAELAKALETRDEAKQKLDSLKERLREHEDEALSSRDKAESGSAAPIETTVAATSSTTEMPASSIGDDDVVQTSRPDDVEMTDSNTDPSSATAATMDSQPEFHLESLQEGIDELDHAAAALGGETSESANAAMDTGSQSPAAGNAAEDAGVVPDAASTSAERPRITAIVNGAEVDITDSGIDPEFLEALPPDMREEVLNQHFREQRATITASQAAEANIAPEFLNALPPEIRAEVIHQQSAENNRRQREAQRAGQAANGEGSVPPQAEDMDSASFLATLDPDLRRAVLVEQDDEFLDGLPPHLVEELQLQREAHRREREQSEQRESNAADQAASSEPQQRGPTIVDRYAALFGGYDDMTRDRMQIGAGGVAGKKVASRDGIQLLDKSGIATLVRLLFFPQMNNKEAGLLKVLANLAENSKTRGEILSKLLTILPDGASSDSESVDKSYATMSLRATKQFGNVAGAIASTAATTTPSRPTPRRQNTAPGPGGLATPSTPANLNERAPLSHVSHEASFLIASRSIECLNWLVTSNEEAALYFLREDARSSKKGKGKEKEKEKERGSAPVNTLLALLDKESVVGNAQLVESLIALLSIVTRPLTTIGAKKGEVDTVTSGGENAEASDAPASGTDAALTVPAAVGATPSPAEQFLQSVMARANGAMNASGLAASANHAGAQGHKADETPSLTTFPHIPPEHLSAVVRPLSKAISSKGFQNTLAVASHLSAIPEAREVILNALRRDAESASERLVADLDTLLPTLPMPNQDDDDGDVKDENTEEEMKDGDAQETRESLSSATTSAPVVNPVLPGRSIVESTSRISSPALSSLASPSSAQAVLLRSLRALDYLVTGH